MSLENNKEKQKSKLSFFFVVFKNVLRVQERIIIAFSQIFKEAKEGPLWKLQIQNHLDFQSPWFQNHLHIRVTAQIPNSPLSPFPQSQVDMSYGIQVFTVLSEMSQPTESHLHTADDR